MPKYTNGGFTVLQMIGVETFFQLFKHNESIFISIISFYWHDNFKIENTAKSKKNL